MATLRSNEDGSDIFWPGYVDAVTNLVLNLLFLLTIMIVAVFMFALELGRSSKIEAENVPVASTVTLGMEAEALKVEAEDAPVAPTKQDAQAVSKETADSVQENIVLKREIQRLNMKLAEQVSQKVKSGGPVKSVDATSSVPKPLSGLDKTLASDLEIIVHFKDEAIAFTPEERNRLLESLKLVVETGNAGIYVEVPAGFSEAKRLGFYRAMAVRNLLIEMKMPKENINVSVAEGKNNANASLVRVRSR